jgi:hypothetical protein
MIAQYFRSAAYPRWFDTIPRQCEPLGNGMNPKPVAVL